MITNLNELQNFLESLYPELVVQPSKFLHYDCLEASIKGKKASMSFYFSHWTEACVIPGKLGKPVCFINYQESMSGFGGGYDVDASLEASIKELINRSFNLAPAEYQQLSLFDSFQLGF